MAKMGEATSGLAKYSGIAKSMEVERSKRKPLNKSSLFPASLSVLLFYTTTRTGNGAAIQPLQSVLIFFHYLYNHESKTRL